jgi:tetratricopeptide (TPR) repeat protein
LFIQILLGRAQTQAEAPAETDRNDRVSESGQIWLALSRLEKQIQQSAPDLADKVEQARGSLFSLLSQNSQYSVDEVFKNRERSPRSFDDQVQRAEEQQDPATRDQMLAFAVLSAQTEDLGRVLSVAEKISDSDVRAQLLNWLYFSRAQMTTKDKRFDEARKLAAKVTELDQRAYLYSTIAEESLKQTEDQTQARKLLEEIAEAVAKAPRTIVTARALLALAYLYTKIDMNRAIAFLADGVTCINHLEGPDFSSQYVQIRVEGKTFGFYTGFQTPGFNPENAFREFGKLDYDGALYLTSNFTDKSLRALTTLALADICLQRAQQRQKTKKAKKNEKS